MRDSKGHLVGDLDIDVILADLLDDLTKLPVTTHLFAVVADGVAHHAVFQKHVLASRRKQVLHLGHDAFDVELALAGPRGVARFMLLADLAPEPEADLPRHGGELDLILVRALHALWIVELELLRVDLAVGEAHVPRRFQELLGFALIIGDGEDRIVERDAQSEVAIKLNPLLRHPRRHHQERRHELDAVDVVAPGFQHAAHPRNRIAFVADAGEPALARFLAALREVKEAEEPFVVCHLD